MLEKKTYGIYNGEVHRIEIGRTGEIFLCPESGSAADEKYPNRACLLAHAKIIKPEELSEAYYMVPCAEYKGYKTFIAREVGDEYDVWVSDYAVAQKLGFERCDKLAYSKMVKKADVKILYEKKTLKI